MSRISTFVEQRATPAQHTWRVYLDHALLFLSLAVIVGVTIATAGTR